MVTMGATFSVRAPHPGVLAATGSRRAAAPPHSNRRATPTKPRRSSARSLQPTVHRRRALGQHQSVPRTPCACIALQARGVDQQREDKKVGAEGLKAARRCGVACCRAGPQASDRDQGPGLRWVGHAVEGDPLTPNWKCIDGDLCVHFGCEHARHTIKPPRGCWHHLDKPRKLSRPVRVPIAVFCAGEHVAGGRSLEEVHSSLQRVLCVRKRTWLGSHTNHRRRSRRVHVVLRPRQTTVRPQQRSASTAARAGLAAFPAEFFLPSKILVGSRVMIWTTN